MLPVALVSLPSLAAHGQALPAATKPILQFGAAYSLARPDDGFAFIKGYSVFADLGLRHRMGISADLHLQDVVTPEDFNEDTFMVGPRLDVLRQDRFRAYVKVQGGLAHFVYLPPSYPLRAVNFAAIGLGGGFEYRAQRHLNVRVIDVQQQFWPGFPPNGLTPTVISFGAAFIP